VGVTLPVAEFLVEARTAGADFSRTLTLGHQTAFVSPPRLRRALRRAGLEPGVAGALRGGDAARADDFLRALGARQLDVLDVSPYEGAQVLHDLNEPIGDEHKGRYTAVLDGGTLEHVFHFPTALRSCMELLAPGGTLFVNAVANQVLGHGMYQFSPELFFRALSPENGFELVRMHVYEGYMGTSTALGLRYDHQRFGPRYAVRDAREFGGRHELLDRWPLALLVEARKVADVPVFATAPQQSDYAATWAQHERGEDAAAPAAQRLAAALPPGVRVVLAHDVVPAVMRLADPLRLTRARRRASLRNRTMFRRVRR